MSEVTGNIKVIGETKTFGTGNFAKRDLVVTTDEQYPQMILIEFVQDKCDILNKYKVGDSVKVGINLRGREWVNPEGVAKYFNSIQGWRIDKASDAPAEYVAPQQAQPVEIEAQDDLPF
tara:strand:- start:608 stop:964 length:357 start_codon:yes stop_codon:yes gene_type:complete